MLFPEELPSSPLAAMSSRNLIDSDFLRTIKRGLELTEKYPELLEMITDDQINHGLQKKLIRKQDQNWLRQNSYHDSLLPIETSLSKPEVLQNTKERMPPGLVLVFLLIRGFLGNIKSRKNSTFLLESKTVDILVTSFGLSKLPGLNTILDNLNLLSEKTVREILIRSLTEAKQFDDFNNSYFDSTRISADSTWPTESKTINDLLSRIHRSFVILRDHGIKVNLPANIEETRREIDSLQKGIALTSGKKNSKKSIKKKYRSLLRLSKYLFEAFDEASSRALLKIGNILPSLKESLMGLLEWIQVDIFNGRLCAKNARERVLNGKQVAAEEKVLGISDPDACIIPKGTRPLVFGYKPQFGRSEKGFIAAVDIPEGANSDADQLKPIVEQYISNTAIMPQLVSCDDGYVNKKERDSLFEKGVKTVSFGGSKGKKLIGEDWDKPDYCSARNKRSMVESTIGTIKTVFNLGRFSRRGISAVRIELLTACVFHNIFLLAKYSHNQ